MIFNSYQFMLFFPAVLIVYFVVPSKFRYIWLCVASYFFYMCWNVKYVLLILVSTLITWISGLLLGNRREKCKKLIVIFSLLSNLLILAFFKYFDFIISNINYILSNFNLTVLNNPFDIILPVGISFYTFQALSYTLDVYRGKIEPEKNFIRYALFVSFFPQLVAGPIERSESLLGQLRKLHTLKLWNYERITLGAKQMLWGYFLKMVIADRLSIFVDSVWNNYQIMGTTSLLLAAVFFSIQIYCDFNSYSTIAIGAAQIMGINLMQNFNTPYFATSIQDFWRRWHISLSTWFRDYLYIPLGGALRRNVNLMITFLVSGLWHGANWNYIAWGALHGIYQIVGRYKAQYVNKINVKLKVNVDSFGYKLGQMATTFCLTTFAWIFFRSSSLEEAINYIYRIIKRWDFWIVSQKAYLNYGLNQTELSIAIFSIIVLIIVDCIQYNKKCSLFEVINNQILPFRWLVYFGLLITILIYGVYGPTVDTTQFIYFQF